MSLTKVSYSMIQGGPVSVMDFGATGDGVTDDTAAIQAAVDYVCDRNISSLFFPFGQGQKYKLTSTVTVSRPSVSLIGDSGLSWRAEDSGFIFSNVPNLVFFDFTNNFYGAYGGYHMAFLGNGYPYSASVNNTQTAMKFSDTGNGPSRPLPVRDSWFLGFYSALLLDNPVVTNTITPSWIDIQDCFFIGGTYAVLGNTNIPTLGLRMINCVSEQGAKLKGNFSSHCEIASCLIEGQTNFLEISGNGGTHLTMRDNYLELNNGDFICDVSLSNASNTVWEFDYFYTFRGTRTDDFIVGSGALVCKGNVQSNQVTLKGSLSANSINVKNYKVRATSTDAPRSILKANNFVGVASPATFRTVNMGGAVTVEAPHGQVTTAITNTTGFTGYTDVVTTYSVGDLVTVTYLVRALDTSIPANWSGFFIQVLNQSFSAVISATADDFFNYNLSQEWVLVTLSMKAENAGTTLKIRCQPYFNGITGAGMQIAGVSANVVTTPASRVLVAPLYPVI
jgi:hypothetical protein